MDTVANILLNPKFHANLEGHFTREYAPVPQDIAAVLFQDFHAPQNPETFQAMNCQRPGIESLGSKLYFELAPSPGLGGIVDPADNCRSKSFVNTE
jgi:hypothetical protein